MMSFSSPFNKSVKLIEDEEFDFDLPMTPSENEKRTCVKEVSEAEDCGDDDDVVFFGPVGHTEKCIARIVEEEAQIIKPLSPLSSAQQVELFKEAQVLLFHLGQDRKSSSDSTSNQSPSSKPTLKTEEIHAVTTTNQSLPSKNINEHGQFKRKLSDTSFASTCNSESDVSENISLLSLHQTSHCSDSSSVLSSPNGSISGKSGVNKTFTLNSPEKPIPDDLTCVLPQAKLKPDLHGVVKFGTKKKPSGSFGTRNNAASSVVQSGKGNQFLKPPCKSFIPRISPPKRQKTLASPEDNSEPQNPRSLTKPSVSSARRSLNNVSKKSVLKPPSAGNKAASLNSTLPILPNKTLNTSVSKPSGLKAPGTKNLNVSTTSNLQKPSGIKAPGNPTFKAPSSALNTTVCLSKETGIKVPAAMPVLMKPGAVTQQRKTLAAIRTKPTLGSSIKPPGPVKAFAPVSKLAQNKQTPTYTPKQGISAPLSNTKDVKVQVIQATPTKVEKKVQPKKIFPSSQQVAAPTTPTRKNRQRKNDVKGEKVSNSSPALTKLVIASGVNDETPSCMLSKQPRVKHTPIGGNKENEPKRSLWSPIVRAKPISKEEELTQCTKRTALKYHN